MFWELQHKASKLNYLQMAFSNTVGPVKSCFLLPYNQLNE